MSSDKKEKKVKKSKSNADKVDPQPVKDAAAQADDKTEEEPIPAADTKDEKKKRKRGVPQEDELEIDINLPEPLSKAAARKAKRQKSKPEQDTTEDGANTVATAAPDANEAQKAGKKDGAEYGIWIGNLPWTIDKKMLIEFFTSKAEDGAISADQITRVHMPAPPPAPVRPGADKPINKGFAYVDFSSKTALQAALGLTETPYGGRNVLIKEAKNFDGRPKDHGQEKTAETKAGTVETRPRKPTKRVFIGNLGFDCTKEDVSDHFSQCGQVDNVHLATFQDTGKCKGFGWVTFDAEEAAEAAAKGFIIKHEDDAAADAGEGDEEAASGKKKKQKGRKWFVNRLLGRQLRIELAEDASTRYEKRFGKGAKPRDGQANGEAITDGSNHKSQKKDYRQRKDEPKKDRNSSAVYGGADGDSKYRTGGIVASAGTKVTFDE